MTRTSLVLHKPTITKQHSVPFNQVLLYDSCVTSISIVVILNNFVTFLTINSNNEN